DVRSRTLTHYNIARHIEVIPHGLAAPSFLSRTRAELGLSSDDFILVSVGRLIKRKSLHHLLHAVAKTRLPEVKILLIGEGPERGYLESLAAKLGILSKVVFLGRVSDQLKYQYLA